MLILTNVATVVAIVILFIIVLIYRSVCLNFCFFSNLKIAVILICDKVKRQHVLGTQQPNANNNK